MKVDADQKEQVNEVTHDEDSLSNSTNNNQAWQEGDHEAEPSQWGEGGQQLGQWSSPEVSDHTWYQSTVALSLNLHQQCLLRAQHFLLRSKYLRRFRTITLYDLGEQCEVPTSAIMGLCCRQSGCCCWSWLDSSGPLRSPPESRQDQQQQPSCLQHRPIMAVIRIPWLRQVIRITAFTHCLCKHRQRVKVDVMASHRYPKSCKYYY